jgi:hypothetical protein
LVESLGICLSLGFWVSEVVGLGCKFVGVDCLSSMNKWFGTFVYLGIGED